MKLKSLTHKFLEGLAETIDSLNIGVNPIFFNPTIAVFSALILTGAAAFSRDLKLLVLIFSISIALVLLSRSSIRAWVKIVFLILAWTAVVSIPLPFITFGDPLVNSSLSLMQLKVSREGVRLMMMFIARVVVSSAIFTSFISVMGWRGMVTGLEGLHTPQELTFLLNLSIIQIPLFLRDSSKMLSAREARVMRKTTFGELWKILATVVGDVLLRSYERAWRIEKAIRSRSFAAEPLWKPTSTSIGIKDLLLLSPVLYILALGVSEGL